jgi:hypothetical protein
MTRSTAATSYNSSLHSRRALRRAADVAHPWAAFDNARRHLGQCCLANGTAMRVRQQVIVGVKCTHTWQVLVGASAAGEHSSILPGNLNFKRGPRHAAAAAAAAAATCRDYKKSNKLVMKPKPPGVLDMLFERGRRDALAWAQHVGLAALLPAAAPQHQAAAAAARGEQAGRGGRLADAADAADQEEHGVWQAVRSLLATPPGELSLMLPVPAELQHML